ncbi:MAG: glycosyltransferase family 4 protein [Roseomonas sp.]|nr:glycosyltransferase family 4 protein [Roseomonas sp.]
MIRSAAILYASDGYVSQGRAMLGRRVAGDSFLNGLLRHGGLESLVGLMLNDNEARDFPAEIQARAPGLRVQMATYETPQPVIEAGTLFLPGPGLDSYAFWRRRMGNQRAFSLCGVTHTTSTDRVMQALATGLTAPVQPWDAIICTSRAVQSMVRRQLQENVHYLQQALGATRIGVPLLPMIPLGVDCDAFKRDPALGVAYRQELGIEAEDIAIILVARLSNSTKFSPLPMYLALQRAAEKRGRKLHLLLAGWIEGDGSRAAFTEGAQKACPDVKVHFVDGQNAEIRARAWAAADIFPLPVDNVQETFGLAPVEAMAAGLPVVVTDWDGFRDSVEDGVTGFRIPTIMGGNGNAISLRYQMGADDYNAYLRSTSQAIAMDIGAAADAYHRLAEDADLRRQIGEAALARARRMYDWAAVIPQYLALWQEQARIRTRAKEFAPLVKGRQPAPTRPDPFMLFADYPTRRLEPGQRVSLMPGASLERLRELAAIPGTVARGSLLPSLNGFAIMLERLARGSVTAAELGGTLPPDQRPRAGAGMVWMMKLGLINIAPAAETKAD